MNYAAIKHISLGLSKFKPQQQQLLITPSYTCHSNHFCEYRRTHTGAG